MDADTQQAPPIPSPSLPATSTSPLPRRIFAVASPHSLGGTPMFQGSAGIMSHSVHAFASPSDLVMSAAARLAGAGFEVLQITPFTINFAGPPEMFERAFNTRLVVRDEPVIKPREGLTVGQFLDDPSTPLRGHIRTEGTAFADVLEGVALEEKRYEMQPSPFAPPTGYFLLRVPGDVSAACNADRVHRMGITGRGVRVAMVDSGWYAHPYFEQRGYRAAPVVLGPGAVNPFTDESGHGTGESANIFAVAPDVELLPIKYSPVNTVAAFHTAVGLQPDIITCSWGSNRPFALEAPDLALATAVAAAVAQGIIVIFSAGNGHAGFPGQHPDVISAGGANLDRDAVLQASNYSSGFASNIYLGRVVPDVCGLVGMQPRAMYIMLPVEPGDEIDLASAGGVFPTGDETAFDDGWAAFSGTSAAAPQLAGVAALMKQAYPGLTPVLARYLLAAGARDVELGFCSPVTTIHAGLPAGPGPDLATGAGLVDAHASVLGALYLRTLWGT
ncbi:MAG TPA: S8 family serine peptidase [Longimicrobium sp.]|nr:S8 family serine peptidase [Longimicrobium sp.]